MRMHADLGERVAEGQRLATVESAEISQIRGDLERSRAAADIAKRNYEREKRLYEQNISPQKEMLDAEGLYRTAEADVRGAEAKLRTYGATVGQGGSFELSSPIAGTVVERSASPGQIVGPQTNLFTVADLTRVWITIDVYEADFGRLRTGAPVTVVPVALPSASFRGRVRSMGGVVDTTTHTFKVRVVVENPGQQLRPGMFAQVRIEVPGDAARGTSVVVPELAVQDVNGAPAVFVATADSSRFVVRRITVGTRTGNGGLAVTRGLSPQDRIVTKGAFQLKAELMKSSFSEPE
jgi:cobalt-zinc-cadmium efflux system membrane fusion protein